MLKLERYRKHANVLPIMAGIIVIAVICKSLLSEGGGAVQGGWGVFALFIAMCCCLAWLDVVFSSKENEIVCVKEKEIEIMKCIHPDESGNFCSQCGVALREKCPECGEMEKIGRHVCENVIRKIQEEHRCFVSSHVPVNNKLFISNISAVIALLFTATGFAFVMMITAILQGFADDVKYLAIGLLLFGTLGILLNRIYVNMLKKKKEDIENAEQEFFHLHPEYAEILKRAEEKKWNSIKK